MTTPWLKFDTSPKAAVEGHGEVRLRLYRQRHSQSYHQIKK